MYPSWTKLEAKFFNPEICAVEGTAFFLMYSCYFSTLKPPSYPQFFILLRPQEFYLPSLYSNKRTDAADVTVQSVFN